MSWLRRLLFGEGATVEEDDWESEVDAADLEAPRGELADGDVPYVNRSAVILVPKQPFVDWLARACGERRSLEELRALPDRTVYLLEPWQGSWDSPKVLAAHAQEIIERELAEWTTKRSRWPKKRGPRLLETWFDIEQCSAVVDCAGGSAGTAHLRLRGRCPDLSRVVQWSQ
jgi:hypothetical protein